MDPRQHAGSGVTRRAGRVFPSSSRTPVRKRHDGRAAPSRGAVSSALLWISRCRSRGVLELDTSDGRFVNLAERSIGRGRKRQCIGMAIWMERWNPANAQRRRSRPLSMPPSNAMCTLGAHTAGHPGEMSPWERPRFRSAHFGRHGEMCFRNGFSLGLGPLEHWSLPCRLSGTNGRSSSCGTIGALGFQDRRLRPLGHPAINTWSDLPAMSGVALRLSEVRARSDTLTRRPIPRPTGRAQWRVLSRGGQVRRRQAPSSR